MLPGASPVIGLWFGGAGPGAVDVLVTALSNELSRMTAHYDALT